MRILMAAVLMTMCCERAGASEETTPTPAPPPERACVVNFTEEGNFFKGKVYKTWQEFSGVSYDLAFRKVAQAVAENNWGTVNADKDLGLISASQTVTMGQGSVAPLNLVVKDKAEGVIRVDANFGTAGGQKASTKSVREELCKLVEAPAS